MNKDTIKQALEAAKEYLNHPGGASGKQWIEANEKVRFALAALEAEQPASDAQPEIEGSPAIDDELIAEIDWCIENGHQGPRSHNLLKYLRGILTAQEEAQPVCERGCMRIVQCFAKKICEPYQKAVYAPISAAPPAVAAVQPQAEQPMTGFSHEDLESVADGLDCYEKTVNVGNNTGMGDELLESSTAYAARFIRAYLAAAPVQPASKPEYDYAKRLAEHIWQNHYADYAPQWRPLYDLLGVLSQIDNMLPGLTRCATSSKEASDAAQPCQDDVRFIGAQLATVAFNLAQKCGEPLTGNECNILDKLRKQWDEAIRALRTQPAQQATTAEPSEPVQAVTDAELLAAFNSADSVIDGLHEVCRLLAGIAKTGEAG